MACYFMQPVCEVGHFTHRNKLLFCGSFVCSWRKGQRGNVALFSAENASINAPRSSLEAPITTHHMQGGCEGKQFHNGKLTNMDSKATDNNSARRRTLCNHEESG